MPVHREGVLNLVVDFKDLWQAKGHGRKGTSKRCHDILRQMSRHFETKSDKERNHSGKKRRAQRLTFLDPETARWDGGLPREGVVAEKVRALRRKFVLLVFRREESGMSREFCWDVPDPCGCSKVCAKKVRAHFSFPNFQSVSAGR